MNESKKTLTSRDWTPLFQAFADALEWVLDRARDLAHAYPDEVAAVERVRTFARKRIAGDPAHVRVDDLLFTFGLVAGAIERERAMQLATPIAPVLQLAPRPQSATAMLSAPQLQSTPAMKVAPASPPRMLPLSRPQPRLGMLRREPRPPKSSRKEFVRV